MNIVNSNLCHRCGEAFRSVETVLKILKNEWIQCESCMQPAAIPVLIKQFRLRMPRWWVVDGTVLVPIWIVESLKKHPEI